MSWGVQSNSGPVWMPLLCVKSIVEASVMTLQTFCRIPVTFKWLQRSLYQFTCWRATASNVPAQ